MSNKSQTSLPSVPEVDGIGIIARAEPKRKTRERESEKDRRGERACSHTVEDVPADRYKGARHQGREDTVEVQT